MRAFLALMMYVDYKCGAEPGFRKAFLVLTFVFVLFLWSPWRPLLFPRHAFAASDVRSDATSQHRIQSQLKRQRVSPIAVKVSATDSNQRP